LPAKGFGFWNVKDGQRRYWSATNHSINIGKSRIKNFFNIAEIFRLRIGCKVNNNQTLIDKLQQPVIKY
jgi:hypothetical protein